MRQIRSHHMTEEQYVARGYELYVFHERETGVECPIYARSLYDAKCAYRQAVANRKKWERVYAIQNEAAMKPFVEKRNKRLKSVYEPGFGELDIFGEALVKGDGKVHRSPYRKRIKRDKSSQLDAFAHV